MAVTTEQAVKMRRRLQAMLNGCRSLSWAVVAGIVLYRLGYPKLEGLPAIGGSVLTVFVATAALLYNRARAYGPGALQRRTLHAAEQALRATLLMIVGMALTSTVFYWLPDSQRTDPRLPEPQHFLPTLLAMPSGLLFGFAAWAYVGAFQTLLPPMITPLSARQRFRREMDRTKKKSWTPNRSSPHDDQLPSPATHSTVSDASNDLTGT